MRRAMKFVCGASVFGFFAWDFHQYANDARVFLCVMAFAIWSTARELLDLLRKGIKITGDQDDPDEDELDGPEVEPTIIASPAPAPIDPPPVVAIALEPQGPLAPPVPSLCGDPLCWCGARFQTGMLFGGSGRTGDA